MGLPNISCFFIQEVTLHKGLEFGQSKSITNLKEVAEYITYQLPRQILKRIIFMSFRQVNAKSRLGLHLFQQIECYVNLCLHA
jgi:hypothetical protein